MDIMGKFWADSDLTKGIKFEKHRLITTKRIPIVGYAYSDFKG